MSEEPPQRTPVPDAEGEERRYQAEVRKGMGCLLLLNAFFLFGIAGSLAQYNLRSSRTLSLALEFFGVVQLVYVLPALAIAWAIKRHGFFKGLLIGAGITFLLTGLCSVAALLKKFT